MSTPFDTLIYLKTSGASLMFYVKDEIGRLSKKTNNSVTF